MARKTPAPPPAPMPRDEWSLAFKRRVGELRPNMGAKYMTTVVATLWPRHRADDPERVAVQWVAEREGG
jgi:hypothetical protein